jgi:hypothetical protein
MPLALTAFRDRINPLVAATFLLTATTLESAQAQLGEPEKDELTFGFIKLTELAPIAIAYRRNANMLVDLIREGVDIRRFRNQLAFGALTPGIIAGL